MSQRLTELCGELEREIMQLVPISVLNGAILIEQAGLELDDPDGLRTCAFCGIRYRGGVDGSGCLTQLRMGRMQTYWVRACSTECCELLDVVIEKLEKERKNEWQQILQARQLLLATRVLLSNPTKKSLSQPELQQKA